ncbi:MAG: hypothetical protein ACO23O_16230, partial [Ilumatobacteraceae bacterium]
MADRDLAGFVLGEAPGTDPRLVARLVERAGGNPLLLEGLLSVRAVARSFDPDSRAFLLDPDDTAIGELPGTIVGLYARLWDELPESVRDVLIVAAGEGAVFTPEWAVELAADVLRSADAQAGHVGARDTYSWVRALDDRIEQFVETALLDRAAAASRSELSDRELRALRTAIVERALTERGADAWEQRPVESRMGLLRHVINATDEQLLDVDTLDCRIELAYHEADRYHYRTAIDLLDRHLPNDTDHPDILEARSHLASWLGMTGHSATRPDSSNNSSPTAPGSSAPTTLTRSSPEATSPGGSAKRGESPTRSN